MDKEIEQRANDMLQIIAQQRNMWADQVVELTANILALQREIKSLKEKSDEENVS